MTVSRTVVANGRSGGKLKGKGAKLLSPPAGEPWVWLPRELLNSDAWQAQSINCRRFIDFLLLDHLANGGRENGRLMATYDQLEAFGIRRQSIKAAIDQAVSLGLVRVRQKGGRAYGQRKIPSQYELTWIGVVLEGETQAASNAWKRFAKTPAEKSPSVRTGTVSSVTSGTLRSVLVKS